MRALKIILIIILAVFLIVMALGFADLLSNNVITQEDRLIAITIGLGFSLGLMAMVYHIKSFRFYNNHTSQKKLYKVAISLWIGAILSGFYFSSIGFLSFLGYFLSMLDGSDESIMSLLMMFSIFLFGALSMLEIFILNKQLKKHRLKQETVEEIDFIGN
ncbi:hypothetical protein U8527_04740 [Kordia algicida OT-1]|uniref:Uncharacterized protein n=1 Tax=Kordia algicida OT-1 TaxID=391587 RepID=A9DM54_9FLAO|nr:hypothetical protein [Kordia algicida]EDP97631.1 hypothetical protein KAOT1_20752 [Kordia algicida OT-1]